MMMMMMMTIIIITITAVSNDNEKYHTNTSHITHTKHQIKKSNISSTKLNNSTETDKSSHTRNIFTLTISTLGACNTYNLVTGLLQIHTCSSSPAIAWRSPRSLLLLKCETHPCILLNFFCGHTTMTFKPNLESWVESEVMWNEIWGIQRPG